MKRENIFKLLQKNYDIKNEVFKIKKVLREEYLFCRHAKPAKGEKEGRVLENFTFFGFVDKYLFDDYKFKNTCLDIEEFYTYCDGELSPLNKDISEDKIINFLEVTENMLKLYFDKSDKLLSEYQIKYYGGTHDKLSLLMKTLEKHMGIKLKEYKDKIILYVGDYKLESALENVEDIDLAVELIKYDRENLDYKEKRQILKQLDILVEPLIDKLKKKYSNDKNLVYRMADDLGFLLNNFNIRHNNSSKLSNDYKEGFKKFKKENLEEIYDNVYQLILDLLILDDYETSLGKKVSSYKKTLTNKGVKKDK